MQLGGEQLLEIVVHDQQEDCPYLPGRVARMPLRFPMAPLEPRQFDELLAQGDRRYGRFLYRTQCPQCRACEPIRIEVERFRANRRQRRIAARGRREIQVEEGPPIVDSTRVRLFNRHRQQRDLQMRDGPLEADSYGAFLVDTCCATRELRYSIDGQLIAVAVMDLGHDAVSAVYTYFDPDFSRWSPGVFSVLTQVDWCRAAGKRHLYLGLYIAETPRMAYKDEYRPHERLIGGVWRPFD